MPLLGKVVQRENRRDWTDGYAGAAVDALYRVNEELVDFFEPRAAVSVLGVLLRMDAVHWAGIYTGRVFRPDTGFCDYERHDSSAPLRAEFPALGTRTPYLYWAGRGPSSSICRSQIPPSRV